MQNQRVKLIVASEDAEKRIRALMQETLLGPATIDADVDFSPTVKPEDRPNIAKELQYFRVYNGKWVLIRVTRMTEGFCWGERGGGALAVGKLEASVGRCIACCEWKQGYSTGRSQKGEVGLPRGRP